MRRRTTTELTLQTLEDRTVPAAAGTLDPTFGVAGMLTLSATALGTAFSARGTASGPNGETFVYGRGDGSQTVFAKYDASGKLDPSFGTRGVAVFADGIPVVAAFAVDSRGRVVAAGNNFALFRLTEDGKLDAGYRPATVTRESSAPAAMTFLPDGRLILAGGIDDTSDSGTLRTRMYFIRLLPDGTADASFGTGGKQAVAFPVGANDIAEANAVAVDAAGRLVAAGRAFVENRPNVRIYSGAHYDSVAVRLDSSGRLDPTFGDGGRVRVNAAGFSATANEVRVSANGRILLAGRNFTSQGNIDSVFAARLTSDGGLDATYGDAGVATVAGTDGTVLPSGRVVISSAETWVRLGNDGRPDLSFRVPGLAAGSLPALQDATQDAAGRFLVFSEQTRQTDASLTRVSGESTPYPATACTIAVGGPKDGTFLTYQPNASGAFDASSPQNLYAGFTGNTRTVTADVNGDGTLDYVSGPGVLGGPNVVVTDGKTGRRIADLNAFETSFTGGIFVAAADLNGDGFAEVVVTPDRGGGPVVVIYDGAKLAAGLNEDAQLTRFFGIADTAFRGGARPALGDVNGDGTADPVIAAGFGGGPRVAIYDGRTVLDESAYRPEVLGNVILPTKPFVSPILSQPMPPKLVPDFFVFEPELRNGVFIAAGDLNDDGKAEIVVGGGPGGGPRVMALDGKALLAGTMTPLLNFFAGDIASRGGIRVAVKPAADGSPRLVTGSGEGQAGRVNLYTATGADAGKLTPFGDAVLADGVYVG